MRACVRVDVYVDGYGVDWGLTCTYNIIVFKAFDLKDMVFLYDLSPSS